MRKGNVTRITTRINRFDDEILLLYIYIYIYMIRSLGRQLFVLPSTGYIYTFTISTLLRYNTHVRSYIFVCGYHIHYLVAVILKHTPEVIHIYVLPNKVYFFCFLGPVHLLHFRWIICSVQYFEHGVNSTDPSWTLNTIFDWLLVLLIGQSNNLFFNRLGIGRLRHKQQVSGCYIYWRQRRCMQYKCK